MTQVTFYQLESDNIQPIVAAIVLGIYRARKNCILACESKSDAESWDEYLWQQPTDAFIPHNLRGEGPANGAPVSVVWQPISEQSSVMVNCTQTVLPLSNRVREVIEFVPVDETGKKAARTRYKQYQQAGCQMQFQPLPKETTNG